MSEPTPPKKPSDALAVVPRVERLAYVAFGLAVVGPVIGSLALMFSAGLGSVRLRDWPGRSWDVLQFALADDVIFLISNSLGGLAGAGLIVLAVRRSREVSVRRISVAFVLGAVGVLHGLVWLAAAVL